MVRAIVKKSDVKVDIKKLTEKEYAYKDKPRYYRAVFQEEKRKLFFKWNHIYTMEGRENE